MKYDERVCKFNMDTGCVELLLRDGRKISINLSVLRMWLANPHSILQRGFSLSRAKAVFIPPAELVVFLH